MSTEMPWSAPELVPTTDAADHDPALAVLGEIPHLVWSRDGLLYHSYRPSQGWSAPRRITGGSQPVLTAGSDGRLHCLFTNEFAGNYEIYYIAWDGSAVSLPINVSRTGGRSNQPAIAAGSDGTLHAVWVDAAPGHSFIYYGRLVGQFWSSNPIPGASGEAPSIAVGSNGAVFVAWQNSPGTGGHLDIYSSILADGADGWSLPENVSDSAANSSAPRLSAAGPDTCHLLWLEDRNGAGEVLYSNRRPNGWSVPEVISADGHDCRLARLACNQQRYVQAAWIDGAELVYRVRPPAYDAAWWEPEVAAAGYPATQLALAASARGRGHLAWPAPDTGSFYYARRAPILKHTILMPVIGRGARVNR